MRRLLLTVGVACALAVPMIGAVPAAEAATSAPAGVSTKAGMLYDGTRSKVLWTKAADTKMAIGSITKVMTALVVIKAGHLDRPIKIKAKYLKRTSAKLDGSGAGLKVGDKISARQLLYGLMLPSGCDAGAALADAYGKGYQGFVAKMNKWARKLGMTRTHYENYDGLNYEINDRTKWKSAEGYSTARDQLKLARKAMKSKVFKAVVGARSHHLAKTSAHHAYTWLTTNHLLGHYPGVGGIKTGSTNMAGYCFEWVDRRGGRTVYGILLGDGKPGRPEHRFTDAKRLLNWTYGVHTSYSEQLAARGLPSD